MTHGIYDVFGCLLSITAVSALLTQVPGQWTYSGHEVSYRVTRSMMLQYIDSDAHSLMTWRATNRREEHVKWLLSRTH